MSKFIIMTRARRNIIICLASKQDLVKSILYWPVVSQLMSVNQFSPKHWNVLSLKANYKESYCLASKQDLVKSILYWPVVSQLMSVNQFSPKHWNVLSLKANYEESYSWKTPISQISHYKVVIIHRNDSENLCIHIITALYNERNLEMLLTETELSKIAFNLHPLLFHMK